MFISLAFAEEVVETNVPNFSNSIAAVVPLLIFLVVFYFLLIRPQQKRQKEHEEEVKALKPNSKVITNGGIFAKVVQVKEKALVLEISKDVLVEVVPDTVTPVVEEK
ncbi:MAG: preprotein translocase subunit YajC [Rickettsiales bacterium]|jgi:preprotein translocase subunit YajC|nr:preprotein translocase subunit YajC [Rickettsiales bacterium]